MMAPQEGQREQSSTAKGEGEDEKSGLLDWGKWGRERGLSAALFYPWLTSASQVWAVVASLIIWQQIETVQP